MGRLAERAGDAEAAPGVRADEEAAAQAVDANRGRFPDFALREAGVQG